MIGRLSVVALALALSSGQAWAEEGNIFSNLLKYGGTTVPPSQPKDLEPPYCPTVDVPEGGAAMATHGGRGEGASAIRSQATLGQLARECQRLEDGSIRVKVGVEVKVLLGPGGSPGRFDVPVTISIRRDEKTVLSRTARLSVTVGPGEAQGFASTVEDNLIVPAAMTADYEIFAAVGGAKAPAKPKARRKPAVATVPETGGAGATQ
jgi:hypothetical protein